jgi:predicted  nucleic acid-binding Zn-ribbon protein
VHLEIGQSADRINEAIAPYRRFVQSTQQELTDARGSLVATEDSLLRLRTEIERM